MLAKAVHTVMKGILLQDIQGQCQVPARLHLGLGSETSISGHLVAEGRAQAMVRSGYITGHTGVKSETDAWLASQWCWTWFQGSAVLLSLARFIIPMNHVPVLGQPHKALFSIWPSVFNLCSTLCIHLASEGPECPCLYI